MRKKKGYHVLLGVTVIFTSATLALIILSQIHTSTIGTYSISKKLLVIFAPFIAAGVTCAVRKRFFIEE